MKVAKIHALWSMDDVHPFESMALVEERSVQAEIMLPSSPLALSHVVFFRVHGRVLARNGDRDLDHDDGDGEDGGQTFDPDDTR